VKRFVVNGLRTLKEETGKDVEINPNWFGTDIMDIIKRHNLFVMMCPGGWWFELPVALKGMSKHICISEQATDLEILMGLEKDIWERHTTKVDMVRSGTRFALLLWP
jgi:hypothetical protein